LEFVGRTDLSRTGHLAATDTTVGVSQGRRIFTANSEGLANNQIEEFFTTDLT
jgi:hypothetical protein